MRMVIVTNPRLSKKIKPEVKVLVFDEEFEKEVGENIKLFDPICHLINIAQTKSSLADVTDLWIALEPPPNFMYVRPV